HPPCPPPATYSERLRSREGRLGFALLPRVSSFLLLFPSFCLLPSAFSPQSPLSIGSLGQSALQATRRRIAWEALGNHSGILSHDIARKIIQGLAIAGL